jgi:hypothetical protein
MSAQPSQPSDEGRPEDTDGRRFSTLIGAMAATPGGTQETAPRPSFTVGATGPAVITTPARTDAPGAGDSGSGGPADSPAAGATPAAPAAAPDAGTTGSSTTGVSSTTGASSTGNSSTRGSGPAPTPTVPVAAPEADATRALPRPAPADMNEPLLGDVAALRARWQRAQAGFVDDPREAVGDAADLIEQTAQALVGALRQRQRQLRVLWEHGPADGTGAADGRPAAPGADTEHLRQMMQRYRALFNQLCRP